MSANIRKAHPPETPRAAFFLLSGYLILYPDG